jgi:hypothetical protein
VLFRSSASGDASDLRSALWGLVGWRQLFGCLHGDDHRRLQAA